LHDSPVYTGTITITGVPTTAEINAINSTTYSSFKVTGSFGTWDGKPENDVTYDGNGTITLPLTSYFPPSWAFDQVPNGVVPSTDLPIKLAIVGPNDEWIADAVAKWYGLPKAMEDISVTWSEGK
jgi:hypothetical protein